MKDSNNNELLTPNQVGKMIGLPPSYVIKLAGERKMRGTEVRRKLYFKPDDVWNFVKERGPGDAAYQKLKPHFEPWSCERCHVTGDKASCKRRFCDACRKLNNADAARVSYRKSQEKKKEGEAMITGVVQVKKTEAEQRAEAKAREFEDLEQNGMTAEQGAAILEAGNTNVAPVASLVGEIDSMLRQSEAEEALPPLPPAPSPVSLDLSPRERWLAAFDAIEEAAQKPADLGHILGSIAAIEERLTNIHTIAVRAIAISQGAKASVDSAEATRSSVAESVAAMTRKLETMSKLTAEMDKRLVEVEGTQRNILAHVRSLIQRMDKLEAFRENIRKELNV